MRTYLKYLALPALVMVYFLWRQDSSPDRIGKANLPTNSRSVASDSESSKDSKELDIEKKIDILLSEITQRKNLSEECESEDSCDSLTSPSDEFYVKTKKLENEIAKLNLIVRSSNSTNPRLSETGRELLEYDDGAIKAQALSLLLSQPGEIENVDYVVKDILEYHDAKLVANAVAELQRYLTDQNAIKIHWGIRDCLLTGSLMVRDELSTLLQPFLNDGSIQFYRDLSQNPNLNKQIKENLISTIDEYQKQVSGG